MSACPRCTSTLSAEAEREPSFPFCSPRCKLVDLGKWLSGSYRIPGQPLDELGLRADGDDGSSTPSA